MNHFLLALDDSPSGEKAADYLAAFVSVLPGCRVRLLTIFPDSPYNATELKALGDQPVSAHEVHGADEWSEHFRLVRRRHAETRQRLRSAGLSDTAVCSEFRPLEQGVSQDIISQALRHDCDTIVVGRRQSADLTHLLLGSVSTDLVKQADNLTLWVVG